MRSGSFRGHCLHRRDGVLLGDLTRSVDVAFQEVDVLVLPREGFECRSDGMTRATPRESLEGQSNGL